MGRAAGFSVILPFPQQGSPAETVHGHGRVSHFFQSIPLETFSGSGSYSGGKAMEVFLMLRTLSRILAVSLFFFAAAPALADDVAGADANAIKGIISSQIEAFQRDDGAAAYDYASPTIKGFFPSVEQFMGMVRNGYQPVYRPKSVTFGPIVDSPVGPIQKVFLTGPDGRNWVAIYTLQRQPDGSWKINGVQLVEDNGATI
jgi:hypothetical protein